MIKRKMAGFMALLMVLSSGPVENFVYAAAEEDDDTVITFSVTDESGEDIILTDPELEIGTDSDRTELIDGDYEYQDNTITFTVNGQLAEDDTYYYLLQEDGYEDATGSFTGSDQTVEVQTVKTNCVPDITFPDIEMTYGDAAVRLDDSVEMPEDYDGEISYKIAKGTDVLSVKNSRVSAKKAGSATIHWAAEATDIYEATEGDITVHVNKLDLGELSPTDISFDALETSYSGETQWKITGYVNDDLLQTGDSLKIAAVATTDSADAGTYTASVSGLTLSDNDKYTCTFSDDAYMDDVTITPLAVTLSIGNLNIVYNTGNWKQLKEGDLSFLDAETISSLITCDAPDGLAPQIKETLASAITIKIDTSSLEQTGYGVGTYDDIVSVTFDDQAGGNYSFTLASVPSLSITTETTQDDKDLWARIAVSDKSNAYDDGDTIWLSENGYVTFKLKEKYQEYDSVAIRTSATYSDTVHGQSVDGILSGTFYLYNSKNQETRTDADPNTDGAQDNTIPEGVLRIDTTTPQVKVNDSFATVLTDDSADTIPYRYFQSTEELTLEGVCSDDGSGIADTYYGICTYSQKLDGVSLKRKAKEIATKDWKDSFDLSEIKEDGYYLVLTKTTDRVGNTAYHAIGIVKDTETPDLQISGMDNGGIYNDDVDYMIRVSDPGDIVTGLSEINVTVRADGEKVTSDETYTDSFTLDQTAIDALQGESIVTPDTSSALGKEIVLSGHVSKEINSSNITVTISAKDRAGNTIKKEYKIDIDTDAPEVNVSYDNNSARNKTYFKDTRTATIVINERNFDESKVCCEITVDGKEKNYSVDDLKSESANCTLLKKVSNSGDKTTYQVTFGKDKTDHEYAWNISLTDKAGNESEPVKYSDDTVAADEFTVDMLPIKASLTFKTSDGKKLSLSSTNTYTNKQVTASIKIKENHFDVSGSDVTIIQTDGDGNTVNVYDKGAFLAVLANRDLENRVLDDTYTFPVFSQDAIYDISVSLMDKAGNVTTISNKKMTIDQTAPTGSISIQTDQTSGAYTLFHNLAKFWHMTNNTAVVSAETNDATSGVADVRYYLYTPEENASGEFKVPKISSIASGEWKTWPGTLRINTEQQCIVYLKVTDKAGNSCYINANEGIIVDKTSPSTPQIDLSVSSTNGIYNTDVPFTFTVTDPASDGTYSGIRSVSYEVIKDGEVTQKNTYSYRDRASRVQSAAFSETVSAKKNNSNNVKIRVTVYDYAGNSSSIEKNVKIDITAPRIEITYDKTTDNNYYNSIRTATIKVYERNFDPSGFTISLKGTAGKTAKMSSWKLASNMGKTDEAVSTATVTFSEDDVYAVTASVKDLAGNTASLNRTDRFTIDTTKPTVQISFDNNDAKNKKYYNKKRTATITVTDKNFNRDKFVLNMTSKLDDEAKTAPAITGWSDSGSTHKATLVFDEDGTYQFSCVAKDLAGNTSETAKTESFVIDCTAPVITIDGVEDANAYNGEVHASVIYSDANAGDETATVTLNGARHDRKDLSGNCVRSDKGGKITLDDFSMDRSEDDVYTLQASFTDLAGNEAKEKVQFSINRFGSNFTYADSTKDALEQYYISSAEDLVINETNVDSLVHKSITIGYEGTTKELKEGTDYTVEESKDSGWKVYTYKIDASNFSDEGLYEFIITSTDSAGNTQDNKLKDTPISVVLDKTDPSAVITGVKNKGRYNATEKDVTVTLQDNYRVGKAKIYVNGDLETTLSSQEIEKSDGKYTLMIAEGSAYQTVSVNVYDMAGNVTKTEPVSFLISSSFMTQYFYNRPLFYGSIFLLLLMIASGGYIVYKKRKK